MARLAMFLGTVLAAAVVWTGVRLSMPYTTRVSVALRVSLPEGTASATRLPRTLEATVRASGWQIARLSMLGRPICRIDPAEVSTRGGITVLNSRVLTSHIDLPAEAMLIDIDPDSLSITPEPMSEKNVPIVPLLSVRPAAGFESVGAPVAIPDSVRISGAASVIAPITAWPTRMMVIRDAARPVTVLAPLSDSLRDIVSLSTHDAQLVEDIEQSAERLVPGVPLEIVNGAAGAVYSIDPPTTDVWLRGGAETLAAISAADLHAIVDAYAIGAGDASGAKVLVSAPRRTTVFRQSVRHARAFLHRAL